LTLAHTSQAMAAKFRRISREWQAEYWTSSSRVRNGERL
jgi:hypothetical protein